jgi:hypothetical protein
MKVDSINVSSAGFATSAYGRACSQGELDRIEAGREGLHRDGYLAAMHAGRGRLRGLSPGEPLASRAGRDGRRDYRGQRAPRGP